VIEKAVLEYQGQLLFFLQPLKEFNRGEKNRSNDLFQNLRGVSFLALCDNFIDVRMLAQKAVSKWHGIGTWVRPRDLAFGKASHSNIRNTTIFCLERISGF